MTVKTDTGKFLHGKEYKAIVSAWADGKEDVVIDGRMVKLKEMMKSDDDITLIVAVV